jgi:ankyrin repeat protein
MKKPATTAILVTTAFLTVALLGMVGCGNRERSEPANTEPPKPPGVSLHEAVIVDNVKAIEQHIAAGSDLDEKDDYGSTPLIIAATFGKAEAAKALIEGGADLGMTNNDGSTALHVAAFLCHVEIVEALLKGGADKDAKNNAGRTALDAVSGSFEGAKPIYDELGAALGPLGLQLDYEYIQATRPKIAEMLR